MAVTVHTIAEVEIAQVEIARLREERDVIERSVGELKSSVGELRRANDELRERLPNSPMTNGSPMTTSRSSPMTTSRSSPAEALMTGRSSPEHGTTADAVQI